MELGLLKDEAKTDVGSYFISNYPPFSVWSADHVPSAFEALDRPTVAADAPPLGLYMHIPFCRKRCKFCYFRVYTDKNARDIDVYMDALAREVELYAQRAALSGRNFDLVYFGGGTPSYLSSEQLNRLIDRIRQHWSWDEAREVTFECEPGTLKKGKLETIKQIGVTRLSLGVEHFDDEVLSINGRAHKSPEVFRAYEWIGEVGFDQVNIDLIAGMVGDTEEKWNDTVEKALKFSPDSITIYQMEVPHNTVIASESKDTGGPVPVADWETKRRWVDYAFDSFIKEGYEVSSAYTLVKPDRHAGFAYRDALWHGADLVATGVASFAHLSGVHFQNDDSWEGYVGRLGRGELPISRALPLSADQLLIRSFALQHKLGSVDAGYFRKTFGVEVVQRFKDAYDELIERGWVTIEGDQITVTRAGLLRVDGWIPLFFEPQYRNIRYT